MVVHWASWVLTILFLKLSTWVESLYRNSTVDMSWSSTVLTIIGSISEQGKIPMWLCTLASWVLTVLFLKLSTWVESLYRNSTVDTSWSSTVLTTIGSISKQDKISHFLYIDVLSILMFH